MGELPTSFMAVSTVAIAERCAIPVPEGIAMVEQRHIAVTVVRYVIILEIIGGHSKYLPVTGSL